MDSEFSGNESETESQRPGDHEMLKNPGKLYLVTGGSGFLGRHVVDYLRQNNLRVRVLDLKQPANMEELDRFHQASVVSYEDVLQACAGVDCVFHIASLTSPWEQPNEYNQINVLGTQNVIRACLEQNVSQLIYTSSSSVVLDGRDCQQGDESMRYPQHHLDRYSYSKCQAEQCVLAANGHLTRNKKRIATCALRPHSIFGPGDTHFIAQLITKARNGDITHMIGEGTNIADFTYVDNVVYAHALAAENLGDPDTKPAGQVYFITNGEPTLFWSFITRILAEVGCPGPTRHISFRVAYGLAWMMEFFYWLVGWMFGWKPLITRQMVATMACHHWFSIEKAARDLKYMPIVTLDDGIKRTAAYFSKPGIRPQNSLDLTSHIPREIESKDRGDEEEVVDPLQQHERVRSHRKSPSHAVANYTKSTKTDVLNEKDISGGAEIQGVPPKLISGSAIAGAK